MKYIKVFLIFIYLFFSMNINASNGTSKTNNSGSFFSKSKQNSVKELDKKRLFNIKPKHIYKIMLSEIAVPTDETIKKRENKIRRLIIRRLVYKRLFGTPEKALLSPLEQYVNARIQYFSQKNIHKRKKAKEFLPRRFEIMFFISIPLSILISFLESKLFTMAVSYDATLDIYASFTAFNIINTILFSTFSATNDMLNIIKKRQNNEKRIQSGFIAVRF